MKKIIAFVVLVFLCSCGPSAEEKAKVKEQNQLSPEYLCIVEKISRFPHSDGIYKIKVDSSEYILASIGNSVAIIKHK